MTVSLGQYQRQRHVDQLLATERETAALLGQLEAQLPADIYRKVETRLDDKEYRERYDYALKAANRLQAMAEIVEDADRILWNGNGHIDIFAGNEAHRAVPVNWRVMTHLALKAGWVRIGRNRLEKRAAGSAANTPAAQAPKHEDPQQSQDTTDGAVCQNGNANGNTGSIFALAPERRPPTAHVVYSRHIAADDTSWAPWVRGTVVSFLSCGHLAGENPTRCPECRMKVEQEPAHVRA